MCYHPIGFHTYQRFQASRAIWRCSTCGRESVAPVDCCTEPSFASVRHPGLAQRFRRCLGSMGNWVLSSLGAIRQRRRQIDIGRVVGLDDERLVRELSDIDPVESAAEPQRTKAQTQTESAVETTCVSV